MGYLGEDPGLSQQQCHTTPHHTTQHHESKENPDSLLKELCQVESSCGRYVLVEEQLQPFLFCYLVCVLPHLSQLLDRVELLLQPLHDEE
jgi:hypothetical protein